MFSRVLLIAGHALPEKYFGVRLENRLRLLSAYGCHRQRRAPLQHPTRRATYTRPLQKELACLCHPLGRVCNDLPSLVQANVAALLRTLSLTH